MQHLDTSDPARLEAQLEAQPLGTTARVEAADGVVHHLTRVPGGWYLPGDLVVASGDVADGRPRAVSVLADLDALAAEQGSEYLTPDEVVARAQAALDRGDAAEAIGYDSELDDLDSVGWPGAGALRDAIRAAFGDEPYDEEDGR